MQAGQFGALMGETIGFVGLASICVGQSCVALFVVIRYIYIRLYKVVISTVVAILIM
jgi:hypothetical protein